MPVNLCFIRGDGATMARIRPVAWSLTAVVLASAVAGAQTATRLSFTEEQAEAGSVAYAERCASCHGDTLDDGEVAPPLSPRGPTSVSGGGPRHPRRCSP